MCIPRQKRDENCHASSCELRIKNYFRMKKQYIFILALCVLVSDLAYSQIQRPRRIEVGLIAGPTVDWATANTRSYSSSGIKLGGVYGLNLDINLAPTSSNYFFSTGINARHIRFGLKYKDNYLFDNMETYEIEILNNATVESTFNTTYISIPTAIRLKTNTFGDFAFWGLLGLEHSIAAASKSNDDITREDGRIEKQDKVNHYKDMSFFKESLYIVLGAEYIIQNNTKVTLGIGYDHGFNNMFRKKYKNSLTNESINIHTHRLELQVGVVF